MYHQAFRESFVFSTTRASLDVDSGNVLKTRHGLRTPATVHFADEAKPRDAGYACALTYERRKVLQEFTLRNGSDYRIPTRAVPSGEGYVGIFVNIAILSEFDDRCPWYGEFRPWSIAVRNGHPLFRPEHLRDTFDMGTPVFARIGDHLRVTLGDSGETIEVIICGTINRPTVELV